MLGENLRIEMGNAQDTVSLQEGNKDGLTHCGDREFSLVQDPSLPNFVTFDQTANALVVAPTLSSEVGQWQVTTEIRLASQPSITDRANVNFIVNPCQVKSLSAAATPSMFTYNVGSGSVNTFDLAFLEEPSCGYDVSV